MLRSQCIPMAVFETPGNVEKSMYSRGCLHVYVHIHWHQEFFKLTFVHLNRLILIWLTRPPDSLLPHCRSLLLLDLADIRTVRSTAASAACTEGCTEPAACTADTAACTAGSTAAGSGLLHLLLLGDLLDEGARLDEEVLRELRNPPLRRTPHLRTRPERSGV